MREVLKFLEMVSRNNNREWFHANKHLYTEAQERFNGFVSRLIDGISTFDSSIIGLKVADCTYRFYRDTRFSHNKDPYKSHLGAYICPRGKKSGLAGYYFHLEAENEAYIGDNIICAGLHCPEPKVIRSVREEIFDNTDDFITAVKNADSFSLDNSTALKRTPREYPSDCRAAEYLKLKDFLLSRSLPMEMITRSEDELLEFTLSEFKKTAPFISILNRAAEYAFEEM